MLGHIRIRSERTPYRRAGLVFGESREIEMPIAELTGAQLLLLAQDPALRVEAWDESQGKYRSVGDLAAGATAEDLQRVIDFHAQQVPLGDGASQPRSVEDVDLAIHGQRVGELADFLEAREGFERGEGEHPASAAIRVMTALDATIAELAAPEPANEQEPAAGAGGAPTPPAAPAEKPGARAGAEGKTRGKVAK